MSLTNIPDSVLFIIMGYIPDNKGSLSLAISCDYFKNLFYKHGFLKYISIEPLINNNLYNLAILTSVHRRTLKTISIRNCFNPHMWIQEWPKVIFLNYCIITSTINPPNIANTELMYLLNINSDLITINWLKFPKLKRIELTNGNININGIEKCKNLLNIKIFSKKGENTTSEYLDKIITYI